MTDTQTERAPLKKEGPIICRLLPSIMLIAYDTLTEHPVAGCVGTVADGTMDLGNQIMGFPWEHFRLVLHFVCAIEAHTHTRF